MIIPRMVSDSSNLVGPRLLLVEDSPEDVLFLQHAFAKTGFQPPCDQVVNGLLAQAYLLRKDQYSHLASQPLPRLILSDIKMPLCTGLELLTWLRKRPELRHVPVVMWSSSDFEQDVRTADHAGASYYLTKPSTLNGFLDVARTLEQIWTYDCCQGPAFAAIPQASMKSLTHHYSK
jgi:two-component system, response regulator